MTVLLPKDVIFCRSFKPQPGRNQARIVVTCSRERCWQRQIGVILHGKTPAFPVAGALSDGRLVPIDRSMTSLVCGPHPTLFDRGRGPCGRGCFSIDPDLVVVRWQNIFPILVAADEKVCQIANLDLEFVWRVPTPSCPASVFSDFQR